MQKPPFSVTRFIYTLFNSLRLKIYFREIVWGNFPEVLRSTFGNLRLK